MRSDYIEPELYKRIYCLLTYDNALALRTSLETGLRIGDVLKIKKTDVKGGKIYYTAQKTGKKGTKTITKDLERRLLANCQRGYCFLGRGGEKPRTRQAVWKDVKRAAKIMGITENVAPHSARKTYAVEDYHRHGLLHTQHELQHSSKDTTAIYAYSDNDKHNIQYTLQRIEKKIDKVLAAMVNLSKIK